MAIDLAASSLGKISGLCAVYSRATLNGRPYDRIYKDILAGNNYRFNEMMRRGGILCEFGHPSQFTADFERTETDPEKAVAILTEIREGEEGKVYAEGYILDTPAGRTYKAIAPFYKFGFSSRGSYEADEDSSEGPGGWNQDSYLFKGFDIVILPATEESEVSATESVKGKRSKKRKSARESLDLNNISDAANVDKDEVERELDKLFDENGNLAPVEYVDSRTFAKEVDRLDASKPTKNNEGSILLDLHKVLTEKSDLEKQVQKLLFEKAESDAAIISLKDQISQVSAIKDEAEKKLFENEQANQEIQHLVDRLLETYSNYTMETQGQIETSTQLADRVEQTAQSLASRVAQLEQTNSNLEEENNQLTVSLDTAQEQLKAANISNKKLFTSTEQLTKRVKELEATLDNKEKDLNTANESVEQYKKALSKARTEIVAARESLIDTYSNIYSISKESLRRQVDSKTSTVEKIKSAAEQLSNDTIRFASYSQLPPAASRTSAPQAKYSDDIEAEMFAALKSEGYLEKR
jgi:hypothetical protein